jgi:hypothetical protein
MDYTVELILEARDPLTEDALLEVAEVGGAASGRPGETRLSTVLTVRAEDVGEAGAAAIETVTRRVAGRVIAIEVMTTEEADRRLAEVAPLVGITEIAGMLDISRQRVSTLSRRGDFPAPLARLASGPVWRKGDLSTFASGWRRSPGRPRKAASA